MTTPGTSERKVILDDLKKFAEIWINSSVIRVQAWHSFANKARHALGWIGESTVGGGVSDDTAHGMMRIVVAVCKGTPSDVRRALREATHRELVLCRDRLGHLHQFEVCLSAELALRNRQLITDWELEIDSANGSVIVRTRYPKPPTGETH